MPSAAEWPSLIGTPVRTLLPTHFFVVPDSFFACWSFWILHLMTSKSLRLFMLKEDLLYTILRAARSGLIAIEKKDLWCNLLDIWLDRIKHLQFPPDYHRTAWLKHDSPSAHISSMWQTQRSVTIATRHTTSVAAKKKWKTRKSVKGSIAMKVPAAESCLRCTLKAAIRHKVPKRLTTHYELLALTVSVIYPEENVF